jgi:hypothetical protein
VFVCGKRDAMVREKEYLEGRVAKGAYNQTRLDPRKEVATQQSTLEAAIYW